MEIYPIISKKNSEDEILFKNKIGCIYKNKITVKDKDIYFTSIDKLILTKVTTKRINKIAFFISILCAFIAFIWAAFTLYSYIFIGLSIASFFIYFFYSGKEYRLEVIHRHDLDKNSFLIQSRLKHETKNFINVYKTTKKLMVERTQYNFTNKNIIKNINYN
jgi:hypothetical protein